jgi:hypothetical protein
MMNGSMVLADFKLFSLFTECLFEREARVRMGLAEAEEFGGVGRGVIALIWLWKCVEKSKAALGVIDSPSRRDR